MSFHNTGSYTQSLSQAAQASGNRSPNVTKLQPLTQTLDVECWTLSYFALSLQTSNTILKNLQVQTQRLAFIELAGALLKLIPPKSEAPIRDNWAPLQI